VVFQKKSKGENFFEKLKKKFLFSKFFIKKFKNKNKKYSKNATIIPPLVSHKSFSFSLPSHFHPHETTAPVIQIICILKSDIKKIAEQQESENNFNFTSSNPAPPLFLY
jgi:hypothetical protein